MTRLLFLLALLALTGCITIVRPCHGAEGPWKVIWVSSETSTAYHLPICPALANSFCPGSYIPDFKLHEIVCHEGEDGCEDLTFALNEAHERRTGVLSGTQTWTGDPNWKDSKKAKRDYPDLDKYQQKTPMVTNQQACGESDCGKEVP